MTDSKQETEGIVLDRTMFDSVWSYMVAEGFPIPQSEGVPDHVWFYLLNHYSEFDEIWSGAIARMLIQAVLDDAMKGGYAS